MEKNYSRRDALKICGVGLATLLTGCATKNLLPTNALRINDVKEGYVCTNEEPFEFARIGLLGKSYFGIPLNNKERILNGGEPSYALIPESKSRVAIKKVGEKGGEVVIDAPEGDLYLPYSISVKGKTYTGNNLIVDYPKNKIKPLTLKTNFKMNELNENGLWDEKIRIEELTEKDFPFIDETLETKTLGGLQYIVNRMTNPEDFPKNPENLLPMYFTKTPIIVEYNRTMKDGTISIAGSTYVFLKGESLEKYTKQRGFTDVQKTQQEMLKEKQSAGVASKQDATFSTIERYTKILPSKKKLPASTK